MGRSREASLCLLSVGPAGAWQRRPCGPTRPAVRRATLSRECLFRSVNYGGRQTGGTGPRTCPRWTPRLGDLFRRLDGGEVKVVQEDGGALLDEVHPDHEAPAGGASDDAAAQAGEGPAADLDGVPGRQPLLGRDRGTGGDQAVDLP